MAQQQINRGNFISINFQLSPESQPENYLLDIK